MSSAIECDVIRKTKTDRVRHGDDVQKSSFLSSFMDSLYRVRNKIMYVLSWRTVSALTRVLFWCLFPSLLHNSGNERQNNPLVGAETVRHSSTCIILYLFANVCYYYVFFRNVFVCLCVCFVYFCLACMHMLIMQNISLDRSLYHKIKKPYMYPD